MKATKLILKVAILALTMPLIANAAQMSSAQINTMYAAPLEESESPDSTSAMNGLPTALMELSLSKSQQEKIFLLLRAQIPQLEGYKKQRSLLIDELHQLSMAETFDDSKVKLVADKLASLEKDMIFNYAKIDNQILVMLTLEQRKQLLEKKLEPPKGLQENKSNYHIHQKTKQIASLNNLSE